MSKKLARMLQPNMGFFFAALLIIAVIAGLMQNYLLAGIVLAGAAIGFACYMAWRNYCRKELQKFLENRLDPEQNAGGAKSPFAMVTVRLHDEAIVYANDTFVQLTQFQDTMKERYLADVVPDLDIDWLIAGKSECPEQVSIGNRHYRAYGSVIHADEPEGVRLGVIYLADLTELYQVRDEYIRSRPVVSIILVDNYEELTKNLSEGATSSLNARINEAITKWTEEYHGLLRRLERNRFLFVFEKRDLKKAVVGKFSLLEDIHEITNSAGLQASLSIGVGVGAENFEEAYEFAALALEMSLSRGGDQAVVKDRLNFNFYGGRARETEHRSKVRSRVVANSLGELIGQSSNVFVMGHRNADMDAVGAAVGVCCLCRKKGKQAFIVLDQQNNAAQSLIEELQRTPQYADVFISGQEAMLRCDNRSTLVVVDTNRPDQVEYKPLLETISRVCVIDHHRRAADYITPVVVNLHEPYASSAGELVTEILEYAVEKQDVLPIEAMSLLSGIILDTKSFHIRTGERTFEAAAFLRQLGGDTVEVKKLLQISLEDTRKKNAIIDAARVCHDEIAISLLDTTVARSLAARAADELVNISGFTASFVVFPDKDQVIISARSIGECNVQVILEPLGGGGNAATAGAQVKGATVADVAVRLRKSIDEFYK